MRIEPAAGVSRPAMVRINVVLPEPFGPNSSSAWPAPSTNEIPAKSGRPPRHEARFLATKFMRASPAQRCILEPLYKTGVRREASEMRAHPPPAGLKAWAAYPRLMDCKETENERRT